VWEELDLLPLLHARAQMRWRAGSDSSHIAALASKRELFFRDLFCGLSTPSIPKNDAEACALLVN
jgi:hypothetical protein